MKNTFLILFSISWLMLVTFVLINLGNSNIPNINFHEDNVDLEFQYPMDWQVNVEGDLTDRTSDKYILLDNKIYNASIIIHEYYNPQNIPTSCEKYDDCGLSTLHESFLFNKADFQQINTNPVLYISNLGGTDLEWDSENNATLRSAKPEINNSYHV